MTTDTQHPLTQDTLAALIESLLFVADQPTSISELAATFETTAAQVEKALNRLAESYRARYLNLQRLVNSVQLVTAPAATGYIERFLGLSLSGKLSTAALEVLGIIAYKQPVTRPEIEAIRGVSSDGVLRTLLSKGLIEEVGRLNTVGHPIQYGTTFEFLKYFGLSSLEQMPPLEPEPDAEQPDSTAPDS
ncbi:MAG: SMC-Scp complex subunit ScpB [Anaerolineae bacterium]